MNFHYQVQIYKNEKVIFDKTYLHDRVIYIEICDQLEDNNFTIYNEWTTNVDFVGILKVPDQYFINKLEFNTFFTNDENEFIRECGDYKFIMKRVK